MNATVLAFFFAGWLRGLGGERALRAFLRAAAAGLEGVEVLEQAIPDRLHSQRLVCEK